MWDFVLIRLEDLTGTSGTGTVAQGTVYEDGRAEMQWVTSARVADGSTRRIYTVTHYTRWQDIALLHGHAGRTVLEWTETGERVSDFDVLEKEKRNEKAS